MLESDSICKFLIERRIDLFRCNELNPEEKLLASSFKVYPFPPLSSPLFREAEEGDEVRDLSFPGDEDSDAWRFSNEQQRLDPNCVISIGRNILGVLHGDGLRKNTKKSLQNVILISVDER